VAIFSLPVGSSDAGMGDRASVRPAVEVADLAAGVLPAGVLPAGVLPAGVLPAVKLAGVLPADKLAGVLAADLAPMAQK